jgi:transcriptional regulator with XRE-family HTH domain
MTISDNLKRIRIEKDIKQEEVAKSLGITRSTYANFENGRDPDIQLLIKLADIYSVSLDVLIGRNFAGERFANEDDNILDNGDNENITDDKIDPRFLWRSSLKSRKSYSALLFMLYLLKMYKAEDVRKNTEDILQSVIFYVIKSFYNGLNHVQPDDGEIHRILLDVNNNLFQLADNISRNFWGEQGPILEEEATIFTKDDIMDYSVVEKYFNVDLRKIVNEKGKSNYRPLL